ncbi:MAG: hypothetical protein JWO09_2914 [Bacteroidetes bacterium]|nr:hypothetical protein [Bacteroidota bacterium]
MKRSVCIFLILMCSAPAVFSQTNYFGNNPVWKIYQDCNYSGSYNNRSMYNYYVKGDTLIGSRNYYKVFKKGHDWNYDSLSSGVHTWNHYFYNDSINAVAYVRDSLKRVFMRKPSDTAEVLLYDFNLAVGDTLPVTAVNNYTNIVVTAIDSIAVAGGYRKRFTLFPAYPSNYLLEGIGHDRGFLEGMYGTIECSGPSILCYSVNDTSYYPSYGSSCELVIPLSVPEYVNNAIVISPNPNNGRFEINAGPLQEVKNVWLSDVLGKIVPVQVSAAGSLVRVDLSAEPAGIYIVHIVCDKDVVLIRKIVRN